MLSSAVSLLMVVVVLTAIVTAIGITRRVRWLAISAPAALIGGIIYFTISVYAARFRGVGHFYSIPFGGYSVSDENLSASVLFWVLLCGIALHLILPKWQKPQTDKPHKFKALALRVVLGAGPLALTPVLAWLISEDYLSFGGGCKDIVMIFPWMAWSLVYLIIFVFCSVRKVPLGRSAAVSAGWATGAMVVIWAALLVWSALGVSH